MEAYEICLQVNADIGRLKRCIKEADEIKEILSTAERSGPASKSKADLLKMRKGFRHLMYALSSIG